jgi:imidazolonepropionase-like amidohydrolase
MKRALLTVLAVAASFGTLAGGQTPSVKAFTGMRLVDTASDAPIENATLVVGNGRILAVGATGKVSIPPGAERVDLTGKTVIPGLINAHGHVSDVARDLRVYSAYGVTTVFSLGGEQAAHLAAREKQAAGALDSARLFIAGAVVTGRTPEEARAAVAKNAAMKVDIIKIRVDDNLGTTQKMAPEVYRAVIGEAHKRGLRVAAHIFYLADAKALLDAGVDLIAHSVRDLEIDAATIATLKAKNVCVCPTLMREVSTFVYESTPPFFSDPAFLKHAHEGQVARFKDPTEQNAMRKSATAQRYKVALDVASRNLKKLADAGVGIAMGTDSGTGLPGRFVGYFEWMELELMAKAGLTPRQILASATRDAARCLKVDKDLGTLEPGKSADFVVLNADPLTDISNIRKLDSTWIAGNRIPNP